MEASFLSMQELFPKVDKRILRGALITHDGDVNEAAEWIIQEILPEMERECDEEAEDTVSEVSTGGAELSATDDAVTGSSATSITENVSSDNTVIDIVHPTTSFLEVSSQVTNMDSNGNVDSSLPTDASVSSVHENAMETSVDGRTGEVVSEMSQEKVIVDVQDVVPAILAVEHGTAGILTETTPCDGLQEVLPPISSQVLPPLTQSKEVTPPEGGSDGEADQSSPGSRASNIPEHDLNAVSETGSQYWDVKDALPVAAEEPTVPFSKAVIAEGAGQSDDVASSKVEDAVAQSGFSEPVIVGCEETENSSLTLQATHSEGQASFEHEVQSGQILGRSSTASLCESLTSSSQAAFMRIEDLEQLVNNAAENKEDLKGCIQEVEKLVITILTKESKAASAQREAEDGGKDAMQEVEQLRHNVRRAREGLETRAGEVYGERAVLAMEARELLGRVSQVKAARESARRAIDELKKELEQRLEVALNQFEVAVAEKKAREDHALALLAREKEEMANIGKQSEALDAEADTCTKLREFLMEKGKLLDSLQGELAVRCEDVETLKAKLTSPITKITQLAESPLPASVANLIGSVTDSLDDVPLDTFLSLHHQLSLRAEEEREGEKSNFLSHQPSENNSVYGSDKGQSSMESLGRKEGDKSAEKEWEDKIGEKECDAKMAVLGGSLPNISYGSQELNVFSSFAEGDEDLGWEIVRNVSQRNSRGSSHVDMDADHSQGSPLSLSVESEKGSADVVDASNVQ